MEYEELKTLIITSTLIFLIGPVFIFLYVSTYFKKRKKHIEEKLEMKRSFDSELLRAQMEVREQTMETIGADLHDNVGQLLSLSAVTLNAIDSDQVSIAGMEKIEAAVSLTMNAIEEMRLLGKLLQGEQLILFGLQEAIGYEMDYIRKLGIYDLVVNIDPMMRSLSDASKELILFRIMQEGLNNVIKHAQANRIELSLGSTENYLILVIWDNGKGFLADPISERGMGLLNITKRAELIGGKAEINSAPGEGTKIELKVPYD